MKTVTIDQFLGFHPCYSEKKIRSIAGEKQEWTALEVLRMKKIPAKDRLWSVLRDEFIDAPILHEFACLCAEEALKLDENPDPRSVNAIVVKRAWLRGEATEEELSAAREAAWSAAAAAAREVAGAAARIRLIDMLIALLEGGV